MSVPPLVQFPTARFFSADARCCRGLDLGLNMHSCLAVDPSCNQPINPVTTDTVAAKRAGGRVTGASALR